MGTRLIRNITDVERTAITDRTAVYVVDTHGAQSLDLSVLQEKFAKRLPPCSGEPTPCAASTNGKDYNYLTVAWVAPHTVVLMAEVPPSSLWGGNMGKVWGYEIDVLSKRIVRDLTPVVFKTRWQSHLGWDFQLDDTQ